MDCREIGLEVMWLDALMTSISPPSSHLLKMKLITVWNGRMPDGCTYPEQPVCTSLLFTLLFIKSQYTVFFSFRFLHIYCFAHLIVLHFLFHCTFYSYFSFFTIYMLLCCVTFISFFILLHCPLSGPDLMYISLLIIPCIIYCVTNKETLDG